MFFHVNAEGRVEKEIYKDTCEGREANKINTITMDKFPLTATHLSVNSNTAIKTYNHEQQQKQHNYPCP